MNFDTFTSYNPLQQRGFTYLRVFGSSTTDGDDHIQLPDLSPEDIKRIEEDLSYKEKVILPPSAASSTPTPTPILISETKKTSQIYDPFEDKSVTFESPTITEPIEESTTDDDDDSDDDNKEDIDQNIPINSDITIESPSTTTNDTTTLGSGNHHPKLITHIINTPHKSSSIEPENLTPPIDSSQSLYQKQYSTTVYRLPLSIDNTHSNSQTKGPIGLYYIDHVGNKIYLKHYQREKWANGLTGSGIIA